MIGTQRITTIPKSGGINYFTYIYETTDDGWIFKVSPLNQIIDDFFELAIERINLSEGRVIMLNHQEHPELKQQGIPEAIIVEASKILQIKIYSSASYNKPGQYRTPNATKVWQRLVKKKLAAYNSTSDIYFTL